MAAVLGMALLLVVLAARLPIGFSLTLVGFLGYGIVGGWGAALGMLGIEPYSQVTEYLLSAVPMFLLMGHFAHHTGISEEIYRTAYRWLGFLPGGLALATVAGCAGFAAASGSSVATAAVMGTVSLPQMARYNYHPRLATGCVAAGGTLGILIPPQHRPGPLRYHHRDPHRRAAHSRSHPRHNAGLHLYAHHLCDGPP